MSQLTRNSRYTLGRVSEDPFPFTIRQRVRFGETDMQGGQRCADMTTVQVVCDRSNMKPARVLGDLRAALAGGAT